VTAQYGTIDKFIGDALMAFWNAAGRCRAPRAQSLRGGARHAAGCAH